MDGVWKSWKDGSCGTGFHGLAKEIDSFDSMSGMSESKKTQELFDYPTSLGGVIIRATHIPDLQHSLTLIWER